MSCVFSSFRKVHIDKEPNWDDEDNIVSNLTCLCIVGIEDPVRNEASCFHMPVLNTQQKKPANQHILTLPIHNYFFTLTRYLKLFANAKRQALLSGWSLEIILTQLAQLPPNVGL